MLIESLMTSPARYEVLPSCTTPLRMGGVQFELNTRAPTSRAFACLTTSQPAIFARNASLSSMSAMHGIYIIPNLADKQSENGSFLLAFPCGPAQRYLTSMKRVRTLLILCLVLLMLNLDGILTSLHGASPAPLGPKPKAHAAERAKRQADKERPNKAQRKRERKRVRKHDPKAALRPPSGKNP